MLLKGRPPHAEHIAKTSNQIACSSSNAVCERDWTTTAGNVIILNKGCSIFFTYTLTNFIENLSKIIIKWWKLLFCEIMKLLFCEKYEIIFFSICEIMKLSFCEIYYYEMIIQIYRNVTIETDPRMGVVDISLLNSSAR